MALDVSKMRSFVEGLLRKSKFRTEREVKAAVAEAFKMNPREIGAAVIRDVRKKMGIDRPSAIAHARALLAKDPSAEARRVIDAIRERYGIRLGPPDVSRLRPRGPKSARPARPGRPLRGAKAGTAATAGFDSASTASTGTGRRRRGRPGRKRGGEGRKVQALPVSVPSRALAPASVRKSGTARGEISMTFEGKGNPEDLAAFFISLSSKG